MLTQPLGTLTQRIKEIINGHQKTLLFRAWRDRRWRQDVRLPSILEFFERGTSAQVIELLAYERSTRQTLTRGGAVLAPIMIQADAWHIYATRR